MVAASGVKGEDRLNILIIAIVIIILGMIVENIRELHGFRTTVYKIASPKLMGLQEEKRIVFCITTVMERRMGGCFRQLSAPGRI